MNWNVPLEKVDLIPWAEITVPALHHETKPGDLIFLEVGEGQEVDAALPRIYQLLDQHGYRHHTEMVMNLRTIIVHR